MTTHSSYLTFKAKNNYELGLQLGEAFGEQLRDPLHKSEMAGNWSDKLDRSKPMLEISEKYFPQYVDELRGYAKAAKVGFLELWTKSLGDEFEIAPKCTTIITNNGKLINHNEDWAADAKELIYLVRKTIGELTIFEFLYYSTPGGNSISINSHGYAQTVNTLVHSDYRPGGIPRHITCRWLSETSNLEKDYKKFASLPRSSGYNHNFTNKAGHIYNLEASGLQSELRSNLSSPYVHTNHYVGKLKNLDVCHGFCGTHERYEYAKFHVKPKMTVEEMITLDSDTSQGTNESIMNERTIGKMILDTDSRIAHVWMAREEEKGWVEYPLDFIKS